MSALPPKADMCSARGYVRFGPKADITDKNVIKPSRAERLHAGICTVGGDGSPIGRIPICEHKPARDCAERTAASSHVVHERMDLGSGDVSIGTSMLFTSFTSRSTYGSSISKAPKCAAISSR